jgi:hypothetical protein
VAHRVTLRYCILPMLFGAVLTACTGAGASDVHATHQTIPDSVSTLPAASSHTIVTPAETSSSSSTSPATGKTAAVSTSSGVTPWELLQQRALHLPSLPASNACPTTPFQLASHVDGGGDFGPTYLAFGSGPVYPIIYNLDPTSGIVRFGVLSPGQGEARQDKVLWIASPVYKGRALIRGKRLGANGDLEFSPYNPQPGDLQFPIDTGASGADSALGWRDLPSSIAIPAPGCYGFQVDGANFSDVIVFDVAA